MIRQSSARRPLVLLTITTVLFGACVSSTRVKRVNVLEYLYPEGKPASQASLVQLELPVNVGVAFVPEAYNFDEAILPGEKRQLLERVRAAFAGAQGLGRIEVVPESFMNPSGGFDNLRQLRSALGIDVIALVSYDQTQFDDPNMASITYWTIVGAYVVPGNENETHTLVHASVFDIRSEVLLLNASGESTVEGRTTAVDLERSLREDRLTGFNLAVDKMILNLDESLRQFREQVKNGTVRGRGTPAVELAATPGSGGGGGAGGAGALGPLGVVLGLLVVLLVPPVRRNT